MQSHTEVLNFLEANPPSTEAGHRVPVMSIAPQSLASLAASLASSSSANSTVPLSEVLSRVSLFVKEHLGFEHVYDTTFARHIALLEHTREFLERKASTSSGDKSGGEEQLPMISSACPGWVCYVEKAHSEMIPFLSRTKSPQQVMGALVKEWLAMKWGKRYVFLFEIHGKPNLLYATVPIPFTT